MQSVGWKGVLFQCAAVLSLYAWLGPHTIASSGTLPDETTTRANSTESPEESTGEDRTVDLFVTTGASKLTQEETTSTAETTEFLSVSTRNESTDLFGTTAPQSDETTTSTETTELPSVSSKESRTDLFETTAPATEESTTRVETTELASVSTKEPSADMYDTTAPPTGAGECDDTVCKRPHCVCASDAPPAGLQVDEMPQFVMLTFDDAVNVGNMAFYRELLENSKRTHKQNGCPIAATFFVSGEYLDYEAVNQLHSSGNEIALHSISHRTDPSYWQTINSTQWEREVLDQWTMLTAFANVSAADVVGFRGPFLFTGGDQGFSMLHKHLRYDSTLVHHRGRGERPFYPYTMDFGFRRNCNVLPCPQGSYPGLWVLPMNVLFAKPSNEDHPCVMADACVPHPDTADDTFEYLKSNFEYFYTTNRAPFPVFLHEAYLRHPERKVGYLRFVDWLLEKDDVYLVTASEVVRFMEEPEPLSAYAKRTCTGRNIRGPSTCTRPTTCSYKNTPPGGERYMRTCSQCPKNYPWVNNPLGN